MLIQYSQVPMDQLRLSLDSFRGKPVSTRTDAPIPMGGGGHHLQCPHCPWTLGTHSEPMRTLSPKSYLISIQMVI